MLMAQRRDGIWMSYNTSNRYTVLLGSRIYTRICFSVKPLLLGSTMLGNCAVAVNGFAHFHLRTAILQAVAWRH